MAIGTENAFSGPYDANGVTTAFPFTFSVLVTSEVAVLLIASDGTETIADTGDYVVTLNGTAPTDGTVTFTAAPESGYQIVPILDPAFTQETQFVDGSAWKASPANNVNDRAALRDQALKRDVARSLKVPFGETGSILPSAAEMAGNFLAGDAEGNIIAASGTGADTALRADLAAASGAGLVGTRNGLSVQSALDLLGAGNRCLIVPIISQSLGIGRSPQITSGAQIPTNLYMPIGGPEWPTVTSPAPLSSSTRPVVPSNFASFVPYAPLSGKEGLAPGMAYQLQQAGWATVVTFATGEGGSSLSQHLAGGMTLGGIGGPYFANLQSFLYHAVKWAVARGLDPVIAPVFIQGHSDADQFVDGGTGGTETSIVNYVAGLTKLKRDINLACSMALGKPWNSTVWITPLLTGGASGATTPYYTLAGRKQVVAAQLQAATGTVQGMRLLPPHSQFATTFTEGDLVHPAGQGFRYYGEVIGLMIALDLAGATRTVPYITAKSVLSATQVKVTFSESIEVSGLVDEATTTGVFAGLEAYTSGGTQLPITAATASGRDVTVTMASTATFSVIRNGLAQETTGTYVKMPRTRIASPSPLGTAQDGTSLASFSIPQEF